MKLCAVVLVAMSVAFVSVNGHDMSIHDFFKRCAELSGVTMDVVKVSLAKANADGKMNCLIECMCKRLDIMNEDGTPNKANTDQLTSRFPDKMKHIKAAIDGCLSSMKGKGKCESAGNFGKCMIPKLTQKH